MPRPGVLALVLVASSAALSTAVCAERGPLVHIQTDRASYRLGETVWFRVHSASGAPLRVRLLDGGDRVVEEAELAPEHGKPQSGAFLLPRDAAGGCFRVVALELGRVAHAVALEVYDLTAPDLDVVLEVIGEMHYASRPLLATFRARDLEGRPLRGARVEYLARFGAVRLRDSAGPTDESGRAVIRFILPAETVESGHLAAGVSVGGKHAAVSRCVAVSSSVGQIGAFPEGGSIIAGHPQRLGLLVLDLDGEPTGAEGRVVDDIGRSVASFRSDRHGVALVTVPYETERAYRTVVDFPAGVGREFPLPAPTGHGLALFAAPAGDGFRVEVCRTVHAPEHRLSVDLEVGGRRWASVPVRWDRSQARDGVLLGTATVMRRPAFGVGHLVVTDGEHALLKRPVLLGAGSPVEVKIEPKTKSPLLAGRPAEFEVRTTFDGKPIAADLALSIFQGTAAGIGDLAARSLVEPALLESALGTGVTLPADFLDSSDEAHDAFLLVYGASSYPPGGVKLNAQGLPPAEYGRVARPASTTRGRRMPAAGEPAAVRKTVVRAAPIERLLDRAHFTRPLAGPKGAYAMELCVPPPALLDSPGLGEKQRRPPQDVRVPAAIVDSRRTLFWSDRVRTDRDGRATVHLRLGDVVADLAWVAQGHAQGLPASGRAALSPDAGFKTSFRSPAHLAVGDVVDLMLEPQVTGGSKEPVRIDVHAPASLKALVRDSIEHDPRTSARMHRFRFEAAAPAERAELRVVTRRGLYREVHVRDLVVLDRGVERLNGTAGRGSGEQVFAFTVPADAVPGTLRVHGSVAPGWGSASLDWLRRLLRFPSGCFQQFTSTNLANLLALRALLHRGDDPAGLEEAFGFAQAGFERLLSHRDPITGGFTLFPKQGPDLTSTVIAIEHLALYAALFEGKGSPELETALGWLETRMDRRSAPSLEALHLTLALHEAGRTWALSDRIADGMPLGVYSTALAAACLATRPPVDEKESQRQARLARLGVLLDVVDGAMEEDAAAAAGETGLMGARGAQLDVATLALAAIALDAGGQEERAQHVLRRLVEEEASHGGTYGSHLALRALVRTEPLLAGETVRVEFAARPGGSEHILCAVGSTRPASFEREIAPDAAGRVEVAARIASTRPLPYRLGCSFHVEAPRSAADAPYRIETTLTPPVVQLGNTLSVRVSLDPVRRGAGQPAQPDSQVLARVGIPGGCSVDRAAMAAHAAEGKRFDYWELRDGYVDLYFAHGIAEPVRLEIPLRTEVAGSFRARPSMVYPYYESGKEHYAGALSLKVLNPFAWDLRLEEGLGRGRRPAGPSRRAPLPLGPSG
jgi:hypothetical protein